MKPTGRNKNWIAKLKEEQGGKAPSLEKEPELRFDLLWVWNGFQHIHRARRTLYVGSDVIEQPLSVTEIADYCALMGIEDELSKKLFFRFSNAMDEVYLSHHSEELKKRAAKRKPEQDTLTRR